MHFSEKGMKWDPLNRSQELFGKLRRLSAKQSEVSETYDRMSASCENFANELLDVSIKSQLCVHTLTYQMK